MATRVRHGHPSVGNGIYRSDYRRRNPKENKTMHRHSFGRNVPLSALECKFVVQPLPDRAELIRLARLSWQNNHTEKWVEERDRKGTAPIERICFQYLRHYLTDWDAVRKGVDRGRYLLLWKQLLELTESSYPWLIAEAQYQYNRREGARVIRMARLSEIQREEQIADFNAAQEAEPETLTDEEEVPLFFDCLSSLDQTRFLYLPPFLKPEEIKARRFGDNPSDRWWEWEETESTQGRPNKRKALV